ncbi:MAG: thioredoxin family protein [Pseudomonadota bacterium]
MALTESNMLPLGAALPAFSLPDTVSGDLVTDQDYRGKPLVVVFMCNHCPFVVHVLDELARAGRDFAAQGVSMLAISSNDVQSHPADGPDRMAQLARDKGFVFPYAYDESQAVAKAFDAACTPDFYLFNADAELVYRGQFDASRPGNGIDITGDDLRSAVSALVAGSPVAASQTPSIGCNIKWRASA